MNSRDVFQPFSPISGVYSIKTCMGVSCQEGLGARLFMQVRLFSTIRYMYSPQSNSNVSTVTFLTQTKIGFATAPQLGLCPREHHSSPVTTQTYRYLHSRSFQRGKTNLPRIVMGMLLICIDLPLLGFSCLTLYMIFATGSCYTWLKDILLDTYILSDITNQAETSINLHCTSRTNRALNYSFSILLTPILPKMLTLFHQFYVFFI